MSADVRIGEWVPAQKRNVIQKISKKNTFSRKNVGDFISKNKEMVIDQSKTAISVRGIGYVCFSVANIYTCAEGR